MACGGCGKRRQEIVIEVPHKSPKVEKDGSLSFPIGPEKPPAIRGYEPHEQDPFRLIPDGPACKQRITGIMLDRDGTYVPHMVCIHQKCEHKSKPVDFDICGKCPFREE